jgi:hypothetical protein
MRIITKHSLNTKKDNFTVPLGEVLHVQFDHGMIDIWVLHEHQSTAMMVLHIVPTGKAFPGGYKHVGSAPMPSGNCWHVFER